MSLFARFALGAAVGFTVSPLTCVFCETLNRSGVSADGLTNYSLDDLPMPTKEELEYVKTWGVPWVEDWDRPGSRGIRADRSRGVKRQLILIRHGQYQNVNSDDDSIRTLTPLGELQATLTGKYLWQCFEQNETCRAILAKRAVVNGEVKQDSPTDVPIDNNFMGGIMILPEPKYIHVSDMTRAQQTVKRILDAFPPSFHKRLATDALLRERFPCDPEPRRRGKYAKYADMRAVEEVFEKYFHRPVCDESSVEIIVAHANVIRYLICRALQLPPEAWLRISLPHCSISSITIRGNGHVSLSTLGSAGHLPVDMVTTN